MFIYLVAESSRDISKCGREVEVAIVQIRLVVKAGANKTDWEGTTTQFAP